MDTFHGRNVLPPFFVFAPSVFEHMTPPLPAARSLHCSSSFLSRFLCYPFATRKHPRLHTSGSSPKLRPVLLHASVWMQVSVMVLLFSLFHYNSRHTAARLSCAEVEERTILFLFALWVVWYLSWVVIAVLHLLQRIFAVFFYFKHSCAILLGFLRTSLYFLFAPTVPVFPDDSGPLSCNHALLSVPYLVTITSCSPTDVSIELLWFDSSPTKNEKAHQVAVLGLLSPHNICPLRVRVRILLTFLLNKGILGEHIDEEWTMPPLWNFSGYKSFPHHHSTANENLVEEYPYQPSSCTWLSRQRNSRALFPSLPGIGTEGGVAEL